MVKFCYLTEASTAETAINSDQEVEKNDPRQAEAVTEEMDFISDQQGSVTVDASGNGSASTTEERYPSLRVEFCPGTAVYRSCIGLFCFLNEEYAAEMASNRDREFISGQKVVVNGSVAGTVTVTQPPQRKQFSLLGDGFFR